MCLFLESRVEFGKNMGYSTDIWHCSCLYKEQYGTEETAAELPALKGLRYLLQI